MIGWIGFFLGMGVALRIKFIEDIMKKIKIAVLSIIPPIFIIYIFPMYYRIPEVNALINSYIKGLIFGGIISLFIARVLG